MKEKIPIVICWLLFLAGGIISICSVVYVVWDKYNDKVLADDWRFTVATVIDKELIRTSSRSPFVDACYNVEYDVEYEGNYYINRINIRRRDIDKIHIGERFVARVLPGKLKRHRSDGLTPAYAKIILQPLPPEEQDYAAEKERIDSMYNNKPKKK